MSWQLRDRAIDNRLAAEDSVIVLAQVRVWAPAKLATLATLTA